MNVSTDFGVWIAALLTLCIFSFLYKDNPFYKFAEHLFVGVSAGYYMILNFWTVLVPNLVEPLWRNLTGRELWGGAPYVTSRPGLFAAELGDYRGLLIITAVFGVFLFTRLFGRIGWLSRWPLAVIIGVYAGIKTTGFAQGDFISQVHASLQPLVYPNLLDSVSAIVFTIGLITSLLFFYFSREHKGVLGMTTTVGIWFLMVGFGAGYGYTVMSRISVLIGRLQFLLETWLGIG